MARSKLVELFNRAIVRQDRKDKIIINGEDNAYPERIERIINNSVTARLSAQKTIAYLTGKGFGDEMNKKVVNPIKRTTLLSLFRKSCRDVAYQKGFFLHVNYDIEGVPNYLDVLRFKKCRISEADDHENPGYVWYRNDWNGGVLTLDRSKHKKSWYYPYNPDPKVILEQRKKDAPNNPTPEQLIRSYRGQVLFVNLEPETVYPNAWIDPAYNDADTEYHISIFRNNRIKTGFVGANIVMVPKSDSDEELISDDDLVSLMGSEQAGNVLKIELNPDSDRRMKDYIHVETVKSEVNTDQFKYDEETVQANILNCYSIPKVLVRNNDSSMFGASGEVLRVAQDIFEQEIREPRQIIIDAFKTVLGKVEGFEELEFVPITEPKEETEEEDE